MADRKSSILGVRAAPIGQEPPLQLVVREAASRKEGVLGQALINDFRLAPGLHEKGNMSPVSGKTDTRTYASSGSCSLRVVPVLLA